LQSTFTSLFNSEKKYSKETENTTSRIGKGSSERFVVL